jgi:hypothetical protein
MEARDSRSKIRPLPIDDIDGDAPHHRLEQPPRRWLPLLVIVVGAVAFGVIARSVGPVLIAGEDVAAATTVPVVTPEATTTTAPAPPEPKTLREMFPAAADGLGLVTATTSSARIGTWGGNQVSPEFTARISQPQSAAYNADATRIALHTAVADGSIVLLASDGSNPVYVREDVSAGRWHPTDPDLYAWTTTTASRPGEQQDTILRVADVSGFTAAGLEPLTEVIISDTMPHRVVDWGDWGFLTSRTWDDRAPSWGDLALFDADGQQVDIDLEGEWFDSTSDGTLLLARADENGSLLPYLLDPDLAEIKLTGLDLGASDFRITSDGAWVLAVTQQADGHTSILARTVRGRSTRLNSINEAARVVDMLGNDQVIVLQESQSGDLVFKDWNTGAEFRVPMGSEVVAVTF